MAFVAACYRDMDDDDKMEEWKRLEAFLPVITQPNSINNYIHKNSAGSFWPSLVSTSSKTFHWMSPSAE